MLAFNADHYHQLHEALSSDEALRGAYELCLQHKNHRLWGFTANILIECMLYSVAKSPQPPYLNLHDWALSWTSHKNIKNSFKVEQYKREGRQGFQQAQGFFESLSESVSINLTIPVCDHDYGLPLFKAIEGRYQIVQDSDPDLAYLLRQLSEGGPTDVFTSCPTWAEKLLVSTEIYKVFNNLSIYPAEAKEALREFEEMIQEEQDQTTQDSGNRLDRPLKARERRTLYTLIAALCKRARIDYDDRGAAQCIREATEKLGVPVSDDTIAKVIRNIDDALESREP